MTEAALVEAAEAIVRSHHVDGLLAYTFERQERTQTRYVGRGRGSATRPQKVTTTVRYQITEVVENAEAISHARATLGWRAFVTDVLASDLSLAEAIEVYKDE